MAVLRSRTNFPVYTRHSRVIARRIRHDSHAHSPESIQFRTARSCARNLRLTCFERLAGDILPVWTGEGGNSHAIGGIDGQLVTTFATQAWVAVARVVAFGPMNKRRSALPSQTKLLHLEGRRPGVPS